MVVRAWLSMCGLLFWLIFENCGVFVGECHMIKRNIKKSIKKIRWITTVVMLAAITLNTQKAISSMVVITLLECHTTVHSLVSTKVNGLSHSS